MPPEVPVLKKCCCIPLRHGLLECGYFKLINSFFLIYILVTMIVFIIKGWKMYIGDIIFLVIIIVLAADVIGNIIFIFGVRKTHREKNFLMIRAISRCTAFSIWPVSYPSDSSLFRCCSSLFAISPKTLKLLKVYYFYSIFLLVLTSLSLILYVPILIYARWDHISAFFMFLLTSHLIVLLGCLLIQAYVLLLIRSHIVKMNDSPPSRFVVNAVEAESSTVKEKHEHKIISSEHELKHMVESNEITSNEDDDIV